MSTTEVPTETSAESLPIAPPTPILSIHDKIQQADDIRSEPVEVPEWGVTLLVKGMSGIERSNMLKQCFDPDTGETDFEPMYPALIVATAHDPDTDTKVFTAADQAWLNLKSASALETVATVALRLSGMNKDAVKDAGKGSSKEGSTDSSSSSLPDTSA